MLHPNVSIAKSTRYPGKGVVSRTTLCPGTRILCQETPQCHVNLAKSTHYRSLIWALLHQYILNGHAVSALDQYSATFRLHRRRGSVRSDWHQFRKTHANIVDSASTNVWWRRATVMATNAYRVPPWDAPHFAFYPLLSRFNHACVANARMIFSDMRGTVHVVLTRSVPEHGEITLNYNTAMLESELSVHQRRASLFQAHTFQCCCEQCEEDIKKESNTK